MEILDLREKRDAFERDLMEKTEGTLITLRSNYPGIDKRDTHATMVVKEMEKLLQVEFKILSREETSTKEGLMVYLLTQEEPDMVKRFCIQVEDHHPLGRLADLDVRTSLKSWSRQDFQRRRRKCYLCDKEAVVCSRSQAHDLDELLAFFHKTVEDYRENNHPASLV